MTRISLVTLLMIGVSAAAYAQAPANAPRQEIHTDYKTLETDSDEIRALDRKRDEALRSNNPAGAQQIQAQIDKLRAARKNVKQDIGKEKSAIEQQKLSAEEKCARDPACVAKKRREALEGELNSYQQRLASDQAAAARIGQDKDAIAKIQAELKK